MNSKGRYSGKCQNGYIGSGYECRDVEERIENLDECSENALCVKTLGSYNCACTIGYDGDGYYCDDVYECSNRPCDENAL